MAMQELNAEVWHVQIILQQCVGPSPPFPCCSGLADLREQLPFIVTWWHVRLTAWCVCVHVQATCLQTTASQCNNFSRYEYFHVSSSHAWGHSLLPKVLGHLAQAWALGSPAWDGSGASSLVK